MKKEKTSIYEAASLEGDVLKTAIKENALPQTAGETLLRLLKGLCHTGWKGQSQVLPAASNEAGSENDLKKSNAGSLQHT